MDETLPQFLRSLARTHENIAPTLDKAAEELQGCQRLLKQWRIISKALDLETPNDEIKDYDDEVASQLVLTARVTREYVEIPK